MEPELDDDKQSLSERILSLTSESCTNNIYSPNNHSRKRSLKPHKSISFDNQAYQEDTSLPLTATTGDIIYMSDGTRKKYNGSSWRRMCSKPNCSHYTQSQGLCKPHLAAMKKRQTSKTETEQSTIDQIKSEPEEPKKGDIIILANGIRKKYDGRQYRRVCAKAGCTVVVHGSLEYQNGLCPHHYHEYRAKSSVQSLPSTLFQSQNVSKIATSDKTVITSPARKRRRANTPSSNNRSQISTFNGTNKITIPKPNRRLSIAVIPASVNIERPNKGDIIEMENGSRKKFDGVVWRTICSIPGCLIAAQRDELCRKHFIKLNGKPNTAPTMAINIVRPVTMVNQRLNSISSTDDRSNTKTTKMTKSLLKTKDESMDYDNYQQEEINFDRFSQNSNNSDNETNVKYGQSYTNNYDDDDDVNNDDDGDDDNDRLGTHIDHTLINALSASREKFPTTYLKKWLREHRSHPYPSNQEKLELAQQSSITYDQVTTWFNNARAILRRRQAKLKHSLNNVDDEDDEDDDEQSLDENQTHEDSLKNQQSLPLFNGVCCRSIGVQCSPSTVEQATVTSTKICSMTDDELALDRTIRILTPSSRTQTTDNFKTNSNKFLSNGITIEDDDEKQKPIIVTSTCLDDDQMARLKEFCSKFEIELSNTINERTTHLITDEEGDTLVCPLSKKVIQAVARHMYIVTYRWIDACLEADRLINEKIFEIQGDLTLSADHHGMQRSRQSILPDNLPKNVLLENFCIMLKCNGCQDMMNNDELIELVQLSGAKHATDSHFSRVQTGVTRIVLCEKEYLINRREMYEKCINAGIHFLTPEWFLESLVQYCIQPFQEYQISP